MLLLEIKNLGGVQRLRWQRKWRGGGRNRELVRGARGSERREQANMGGRVGGSAGHRERDGFSSHTSNYCVTGD